MQKNMWVSLMGASWVACAIAAWPLYASAAGEAPTAVPAPAPTAEPLKNPQMGVFGSNIWGQRGVHRLVSGFGTPQHAWVFGGYSSFANSRGLFAPEDRNNRSTHSIDLAYTPVAGLELSLTYRLLVNSYSGLAKRNLQAQGSPTLRVKYGHHLAGPIALGLQLAATMPTSARGGGLVAAASNVEAAALVSFQPHPRIEVVGNVGYTLDRSNLIFANDSADVLQRYAYQINRTDVVPYGLGAQSRISVGQTLELLPFAELTGAFGLGHGATLGNNPFRATGGAKIYPFQARVIELAVGTDIALGGRPQAGSPFGGQPSWEVFAHLHAHLGEILRLARASREGQQNPASQYAKVFGDPSGDMATFKLQGEVLDADQNKPIFGAQIMVGEVEDVLLATDDQTGMFHSWPIAAGPGLLRITAKASGYVNDERLIPRPNADEVVDLHFSLKADLAQQRQGTLKGTLKDARSGKPIANGIVRVDTLGAQQATDKAGVFILRGKPGRYRVTFLADGYVASERVLTLRPDETLIFNAELRPDVAANAPTN